MFLFFIISKEFLFLNKQKTVEVIWEIIAEEELNALSFVKLEWAVGGINYFS